jgi:hypothetical protein
MAVASLFLTAAGPPANPNVVSALWILSEPAAPQVHLAPFCCTGKRRVRGGASFSFDVRVYFLGLLSRICG